MDRRQALKGIATLVGAATLPLPGVPAALLEQTPIRVNLSPMIGGKMVPPGSIISFSGCYTTDGLPRLYRVLDYQDPENPNEMDVVPFETVPGPGHSTDAVRHEIRVDDVTDAEGFEAGVRYDAEVQGYDPEPVLRSMRAVNHGLLPGEPGYGEQS